MKFQGIVLAGGKSSRFGEDKALARMDGLTMIERAFNLLNSLGLDPVVITNETRNYSFLKCRIELDLIPGKGPMGGLYTACRLFKYLPLVVLTCDMPVLTATAVKYLMENHKKDNVVTIYSRNGTYQQPFPGVYEPALCDTVIKKFIEQERLSMHDLFKAIGKISVLEFPFDDEMLLNINEKRDLAQA